MLHMKQNLIPSLVCTEKESCITPGIFFFLVVATFVEQLHRKAKIHWEICISASPQVLLATWYSSSPKEEGLFGFISCEALCFLTHRALGRKCTSVFAEQLAAPFQKGPA